MHNENCIQTAYTLSKFYSSVLDSESTFALVISHRSNSTVINMKDFKLDIYFPHYVRIH